MIDAKTLQEELCKSFCSQLFVASVPDGLAISANFSDEGGDKIDCFIISEPSGYYMADDGDFIPNLIARNIDPFGGRRREFLDAVLSAAAAFVDRDSYEIRTLASETIPGPAQIFDFMTALVRARDVAFWTREVVRSTFKADATAALELHLHNFGRINSAPKLDASLRDFTPDLLIEPHRPNVPRTAVQLVQTQDSLNEALLLWMEVHRLHRADQIKVVALLEDEGIVSISKRRFQRAMNRLDGFAIFRGDEEAALDQVARFAGAGRQSSVH